MPNHADLAVAVRTAGLDCLSEGLLRTVELMISRNNLERPITLVAKHREVADKAEEIGTVEHTVQKCVEFGRAGRGVVSPIHCSPRHEALLVSSDGANSSPDPVRGDQNGVRPE